MGGSGYDGAEDIALGPNGCVYTTGWFEDLADFNPGPGWFPLPVVGASNVFVSKLDANGDFVNAHGLGDDNTDAGMTIAVAAEGSVYTTGFVESSDVNFDPGEGTFFLSTAGWLRRTQIREALHDYGYRYRRERAAHRYRAFELQRRRERASGHRRGRLLHGRSG